jgi:nitrate reductase gamma subunit
MKTLLWVIVPYVCLVTFVLGHWWRYRFDKFGWTTRSSQLYESRLLRLGSPLFHFGILGVAGGHILGLVIPQSWTDAVGISETAYHVLGMWNTIASGLFGLGGAAGEHYNYREGVSFWFRSIFELRPNADAMSAAPLGFQLHALGACALFALWPFTRLVHVFSAPVGYLTRPYIVYRTRDVSPAGTRPPRRGWERVGSGDIGRGV